MTNQFTDEQVEAACKAHEFTNAFGPERETRMRAALVAAAGAVPVQPSSTVDEGELEHVIEGVINETVEMPLSTRLVLARAVVEAIGGESR